MTMGSPDDVLEFLCDRRFHKQLTLPPGQISGRSTPYRISYSDYGDPTSTAVVLFFGGLMGGRFSYSPLDQLAKTHGVRIIHADRPGVGGSDPVAIEDRIPTYIAAIPHLLAHLGIQHVSLASHSFGTIYLLNTLLIYPHLLHPQKPYVAFFAPWVHPSHTKIAHLQAAEMLPAAMIGKFASLAKFVNGNILPLAGMSAGLSTSIVNGVKDSLPQVPLQPSVTREHATGAGGYTELNLSAPDVLKELRTLIPTYLFAEQTSGVGHDTQLCLRKPRSIPWCTPIAPWDDFPDAIRLLAKNINGDQQMGQHWRAWNLDTFHAETDGMVGEKGRVWFDECWAGQINGSAGMGDYMYNSQVVEDADHDFILDPGFGASAMWLQRVASAFARGEGDEDRIVIL